MRLNENKLAREESLRELKKGNVVHVYPTSEPHITDGETVCWCSPEVQTYDTGGVLIVHKQVNWQ